MAGGRPLSDTVAMPSETPWLLYTNPLSGNCWKAMQILSLTGTPYRTEEVSVFGDRDRDRAGSPVGEHVAGRIPLLVGPDGTRLAESNAILLWFAEGTQWLPGDRLARHRVLEWLFFEQSQHLPGVATARYFLHVAKTHAPDDPMVAAFRARGAAALARMQKHLAGGADWFGPHGFSVADIALYPYTRMAHHAAFDVAADHPAVDAWLRRVEAQPGHLPLERPD